MWEMCSHTGVCTAVHLDISSVSYRDNRPDNRLWSFIAPLCLSSPCNKAFCGRIWLSPRLKQLQIVAKLFSPVTQRVGEGQRRGRSSHGAIKNPGESINPSPLVRSEIFLQMFQDVWLWVVVISCPSVFSSPSMSLYQHLVFSTAGKQVSFISQGFPVPPLLVLLT